MATVRILVVDDYQPWRAFVYSALQRCPEYRIICEVSDGLEAVLKAEELQPDLILLDIGLPVQNGIETARQLRTISPSSKILFVSQESSADIVREALSTGAQGYIVKASATDLVTAMSAALTA